jgi:class 3 adenylate cyclase
MAAATGIWYTNIATAPRITEGAVLERAQRRLAAILAADVVGYSRLIGQDETGTLGRLKELRRSLTDPIIKEHHAGS